MHFEYQTMLNFIINSHHLCLHYLQSSNIKSKVLDYASGSIWNSYCISNRLNVLLKQIIFNPITYLLQENLYSNSLLLRNSLLHIHHKSLNPCKCSCKTLPWWEMRWDSVKRGMDEREEGRGRWRCFSCFAADLGAIAPLLERALSGDSRRCRFMAALLRSGGVKGE